MAKIKLGQIESSVIRYRVSFVLWGMMCLSMVFAWFSVDADFVNTSRLGGGASDVFVAAADDLAGITRSRGLASRLTLLDDTGKLRNGPFAVIEFDNPIIGLASPVFRTNAGFLQGGFTRGGAREFTLPNIFVDDLVGVTRRVLE